MDGTGTSGPLDLWAKSTPGNIFEKTSGDPRAIEFPSQKRFYKANDIKVFICSQHSPTFHHTHTQHFQVSVHLKLCLV